MFDEKTMQVFYDIFDPSLPRLAPGDAAGTRRALEVLYGPGLEAFGNQGDVLDMGCGNGAQTLRLAAELPCRVTAVDNHAPYLAELQRRARRQGLDRHVTTLCADMNQLDLDGRTFDLVWAEGSAYNMGIREALTAWRAFLKPGGALGFSDLVWLQDDVPSECRDFFAGEYPAMPHRDAVLEVVEQCGYELAGQHTLPESSWWEPYYGPLDRRLNDLEGKYAGDDVAREVMAMCRREVEMYRKYAAYY